MIVIGHGPVVGQFFGGIDIAQGHKRDFTAHAKVWIARMIQELCSLLDIPAPAMDPVGLRVGEAIAWRPQIRNAAPFRLRIKPRAR